MKHNPNIAHAPDLLLPRPRLIRRIQHALDAADPGGMVIILAAPGYGKSVLLGEYTASYPGATLIGLRPQQLELTQFQTRVASVAPSVPILVDDIHLLDHSPEITAWLLEELSRAARPWLLAGRHAPPVLCNHPTVTLTLTSTDLVFTPTESRHLLTRPHPSPDGVFLQAADWKSWHTHTGGWPLAVSVLLRRDVAALPSQPASPTHTPSPPTDPAAGSLIAITAMLEALLADLPPPIQTYLLISALPHRFNHILCSELLDLARQESAQQLAEILRRNLFLQADEQPGWYRYHDLIRESLGTLAGARLGAGTILQLCARCAHWFAAQGDLPAAIDHALLAQDPRLAAQYLCQLPGTYVVDTGIFRTYQRWIASLDEATQAAYPLLLIQLGRSRLEIGDRRGAHTWLQRALTFAHAAQDTEHIWQAQTALAKLHNMEGNLTQSLALCEAVIAHSPPTHPAHVQALNAAGNAYTQLNSFRMARRHFEQALAIVAQSSPVDGDPAAQEAHARMATNLRHNLAMGIYIPMGQFADAYTQLEINDRYYATRPVARSMHLLVWCALHETIGDWAALAHDLAEIEAAEAQSEHPDEENIWYYWFKALHATGTGDFTAAQQILDELAPMMVSDEDILCLDYVRVWSLRRMGEWDTAQRIAEATLSSARVGPFYRGMLALEYLQSRWAAKTATASGLEWLTESDYSLSADPLRNGLDGDLEIDKVAEELQGLLQARAMPWIVRMRAYMACCTYAAQPQTPALATDTRRHMEAVLRATEQKFYGDMLILRDPELGLDFWLLCLACGRASDRAGAALLALAQADNGLLPQVIGMRLARLLEHACADVRSQTAKLLAQLGQEQTLPALIACLERTNDPTVLRSVESAVQTLENAPPPRLEITLLGEFKVVRGDRLLAPDDWQRPAVRRLFQYFALHAGQLLSRERILDDLWPDTAPDAARNTFRTLFSWLRRTLDPYLRPKAQARYFAVAGEMYCFAPAAIRPLIRSDMAEFETTVQAALAQADVNDLPRLPAEFLHVLDAWSPLLPELPYEPWAVTARERVNNLYVEGCLYAAQSLLHLQRASEAAHWARKVISVAPWLEEAFQALMRAQARQGQRSLALKTYAEAVDALQRELDVSPSTLTDWLAQRLRQGEDI